MLLALLFCNVFLSTAALGSSIAPKDIIHAPEGKVIQHKLEPDTIQGNLSIITEGGLVVQSTPSIKSPKTNDTLLLSLDSELSKGKPVQVSESKIKPRKGAPLSELNSTVYENDSSLKLTNVSSFTPHINNTKEEKEHIDKHPKQQVGTTKSTPSLDKKPVNITASVGDHTAPLYNHKLSKTHKPLVLSNEGLDNIKFDKDATIPALHSSVQSPVSDQIASPGPNVKRIQTVTVSSHPGMLMPLVITILVVPMFAVIGYMGLKRGQEAWKNRHYKRMDFLLDGMYNE